LTNTGAARRPVWAGGTAAQWREWHRENRAYLFFSDAGEYGWCVDPLAKRRGVPSSQLRGPAPGDVPARWEKSYL
jgi:hypothetical protein